MMRMQSRRALLRSGAMLGVGAACLAATGAIAQETGARWGWGEAPGQRLPDAATKGPWRNMRAVKQKKVVDLHVHSYETPVQGSNYAETGEIHGRDVWKNYADELIASMDRHGIALAALNPAFTTFEEVYETSYMEHKDRFVLSAGFPTAEMKEEEKVQGSKYKLTPQDIAAAYEEQITKYGARMIGETAGSRLRDLVGKYSMKELHPIIDVVLKHDVAVQIHTGWTPTGTARSLGSYQTAADWAEVMGSLMASFPDVKFILAHMGGQFPQIDGWEAVRLLFSFDNAYCDTSKSRPEVVTEAVKGIGAERVMFGSDWNRPELKTYGPYFLRQSYQQWHNLNTIAEADITEDQRDWVLYKSARNILKLDKA